MGRGWQVHGARGDGSVLEVSIYHESGEEWQLMVRLLRKKRKLGINRFREIEVDDEATEALAGVFEEAHIELRAD